MTIAQDTNNNEMIFNVRECSRKRVRCIENGREWNTIADLAREFKLNEKSVRASIHSIGKYGVYHFEFVK